MLGGAALASACTPFLPRYAPASASVETGFYEDIASPKLALLEYRLGKYFAQGERPYEVVCAAERGMESANPASLPVALDPEVELKLIRRFPGLSPLARCQRQGLDVRAADTGAAAAIFDVNEFACQASDECLGWGGYYANGPHGWSYYRLRFEGGQWRIRPEDPGIVLT